MEMRQAVAQDLQAILDLYHEASDAMIGTPYDCCWRRDTHPSDEFLAYFVDKGDMTIAVAQIIEERMASAGDYVETAADRAARLSRAGPFPRAPPCQPRPRPREGHAHRPPRRDGQ